MKLSEKIRFTWNELQESGPNQDTAFIMELLWQEAEALEQELEKHKEVIGELGKQLRNA